MIKCVHETQFTKQYEVKKTSSLTWNAPILKLLKGTLLHFNMHFICFHFTLILPLFIQCTNLECKPGRVTGHTCLLPGRVTGHTHLLPGISCIYYIDRDTKFLHSQGCPTCQNIFSFHYLGTDTWLISNLVAHVCLLCKTSTK